jgi:uncharacterized protein YggE
MSETIITVTGSAEKHHAPERATVTVGLAFDGPDRERVFELTRELHTETTEALRALHDPISDSVTRWNADQVNVWAERPWSQDGAQLALVYHASASVTARFRDFAALASWVEQLALRDGVTVHSVEWSLTTSTRSALTADAQRDAIGAAISKARVFAGALGLSTVRATAVADPGMLRDAAATSTAFERGTPMHAMMKAADGRGNTLDLTPADVVIGALIEARFEATA